MENLQTVCKVSSAVCLVPSYERLPSWVRLLLLFWVGLGKGRCELPQDRIEWAEDVQGVQTVCIIAGVHSVLRKSRPGAGEMAISCKRFQFGS